jgi:MFS transporter, DHA3 family, macrolide efflux protein
MKNKLWTKDFTLITVGTIISAIGGTAMNFALGLVVFDNTASTWLTGIFEAVVMMPSLVLPVLAAPFVDSHSRQKIIVRLDALSSLIYLGFALYLLFNSFSYTLYMLFGLAMGCIGTIYSLAYNSLYPELIPEGFAQKGYSVSSLIYPSAAAVITPIAALVYSSWGIEYIFIAEGALLLIASFFERYITTDRAEKREKKRFSIKEYCGDMLGGIRYLKNERGVRNLYGYMSVVGATASGNYLMSMAHFQSGANGLTTTMFALLQTSETIGRTLGGLLHYFIKIPPEKRYAITEKVYIFYEALDGVMLLLWYPLMIVVRFVLGFLGVNSATLRAAAVQKYLPSEVRARVEALFSTLMSLGQIVVSLVAGALGEVLHYPLVSVLFGVFGLMGVYWFVVRNRRQIAALYETER